MLQAQLIILLKKLTLLVISQVISLKVLFVVFTVQILSPSVLWVQSIQIAFIKLIPKSFKSENKILTKAI